MGWIYQLHDKEKSSTSSKFKDIDDCIGLNILIMEMKQIGGKEWPAKF